MKMMRSRSSSGGFTLIETLVAISLFAIMTVGIVPLLASSIKGSNLSRSYTIGKNLAVDSMERIRGLPYSVAIGAQPTNDGVNKTKVDVLDLYYPCATSAGCGGTGTNYLAGVFTTTCVVGSTNPACPRAIPASYTVTYYASFVQPTGSTPENYSIMTTTTNPAVPDTYDWKTTNRDRPPSKLLQIKVSVTWKLRSGNPEVYELESLKTERKVGRPRVTGSGQVDYSVRVDTTYAKGTQTPSKLVATGASGSTSISLALSALGTQTARAGEITLVQEATTTSSAVVLSSPPTFGATESLQAPPDQSPAGTPKGASILTHPQLCQDPAQDVAVTPSCPRKQVGQLAATETSGLSVVASNELPSGAGIATLNPSTSPFDLFVDSQKSVSDNPLRLLIDGSYVSGSTISSPVFSVSPNSLVPTNTDCSPTAAVVACRSMFAATSGATGALGAADRRVETNARTGLAEANFFPVDFIPGAASDKKVVLRISKFTAASRCVSTGAATGSSAAASWSAELNYYSELLPNDNVTKGKYLDTPIAIDSTNFGTVLADLKAQNPMVYEAPSSATTPTGGDDPKDIYLFPQAHSGVHLEAHPSYFINITGSSPVISPVGDGKSMSASISGALNLTTAPTEGAAGGAFSGSSLNIQLGALSCSSADRR